MDSRDTEIFLEFLKQKKALISGNADASLSFLKEIGIVSDNGDLVRKHRLNELTGSRNEKAHKFGVSKKFYNKNHRSKCIPQGQA